MVCTNPVLKHKEGGSKLAIDEVVDLCSSNNEIVFLTAMSPKDKALLPHDGNDSGNTYYFRQGMFRGEYLHILTDLNICFWSKLRKVVKKEKIDLISVTMPYGIVSASIVCRGIPVIYDSHSVMSDTVEITWAALEKLSWIFRVPIANRVVKLMLQGYISFIERLACNRATHIKAVGESDKQRFVEKFGVKQDKITTISPFISSHELVKVQPKQRMLAQNGKIRVVFHGSYDYSSNYDAFELILNYIAPEVERHNGNIQFLLAGVNVPTYERGNVKSLGFVEDIQALLVSADMAIVPHTISGGIRTKIFDYMLAGLPIISTKGSIQNIEAEDGKHAVILDGVDQKFINAILDLANDSKKRELLGRNALELAKTKYSRESMQARVNELLAKVAP